MSFRGWAREATFAVAEKTSAYRLLGSRFSGVATIFVLHRIIRDGDIVLDPALAISEKFLDAAVSHVIRRGYEIVSLDELYYRTTARSFTRPMVVFTFDDGYRDNGTIASKVFERYKVPWSLYLTTGFPDRTCRYWWGALEQALLDRDKFDLEMPNLRWKFAIPSLAAKRAAYRRINRVGLEDGAGLSSYLATRYNVDGRALLAEAALSWAEIRELVSGGLMELGGHTVGHPVLTQLENEDARREIAGCRSRIQEMIGISVSHFAHPYGAATARDYALVRQEGFKTATGTVPSNLFPPPEGRFQVLPRIRLDGRDERLSQLDLHLSGLTGLYYNVSAGLLKQIKRIEIP
jgi:peptidoglycan/xylan/chitin deacetylase (PgdA/CDA1 family)